MIAPSSSSSQTLQTCSRIVLPCHKSRRNQVKKLVNAKCKYWVLHSTIIISWVPMHRYRKGSFMQVADLEFGLKERHLKCVALNLLANPLIGCQELYVTLNSYRTSLRCTVPWRKDDNASYLPLIDLCIGGRLTWWWWYFQIDVTLTWSYCLKRGIMLALAPMPTRDRLFRPKRCTRNSRLSWLLAKIGVA